MEAILRLPIQDPRGNKVYETDVPETMIDFAEEMCSVFAPHDIFVMDVALHSEMYKVVECNCFNSSGTYRHDWGRIVREVQGYFRPGRQEC